ncbi:PncB Nicotinic acid phosphoribosyltransferase [uncultured Caudovirales phage]|uniref:Nicotinamide phosphoribosyltransferase n=1 Tax=uncultured Caudovirales phage TaxID=2100421 RepID=A0A6J5TAZ1_9CAUD|nr:PncB Nicotinic acid phosphoribosyltransferase [uncultured Caudovirales phage]
MKLAKNVILNTDSYKVSMFKQYPAGTTGVYSYIESRGGRYDRTVFFGLQAFIKEYLLDPITQADIDIADEIITAHGEPFNRAGWQYILDKHNGYLPVVIRAVPEGTVVPVSNVLATIENTDPECFWLTTWLETALLRAIWYPTTVSTQSHKIKQVILDALEKTGDPTSIDFKLHDFGARGVSSMESAGIGSAAHLVNFMGTDTITGVLYAREYYNAGIAGFSIPAAEHSTITSWGRNNEVDAYRNMLKQFAKPGSVVAIVSDSYDIYNAVDNLWGEELRDEVIASGATVVIRPDSGDPDVVCRQLVQKLDAKFGHTTNAKGFKVLNNVRLIQGDGVNEHTIRCILGSFQVYGYSADNIAFGMGGALLQIVDRDTQRFAMKCSSAKINGEWVDVQKDPITDSGKRSKAGRVTLWTNSGGEFASGVTAPTGWTDKGIGGWTEALSEVYRDGKLVSEITFEQVRANARK